MAFLLVAFVAVGLGLIAAGAYTSPSFRYLNAIFPPISSENPLTESVAEHLTPTLVDYFLDYSILIIFAGLGAWVAFQKRNDSMVFALIVDLTGLYVSATFARLLVFSSIGIIMLAGIGLAEVTKAMLERREGQQQSAKGRKAQAQSGPMIASGSGAKMIYVGVIIAMLSIPMFYPASSSWVAAVEQGGSSDMIEVFIQDDSRWTALAAAAAGGLPVSRAIMRAAAVDMQEP